MRVLGLTAIIALISLAPSSVAVAGEKGTDGSGASGSAYDGVISAGVQFGRPPRSKGAPDASGCVWSRPIAGDHHTWSVIQRGGITYRLWFRRCPTRHANVWIREGIPTIDLGFVAADRVVRSLPPPQLSAAPPLDRGIVNVGMWFWVDATAWRPISATAWVPTPNGIVWSTATARPTRLVFDPGDGALGDGPVSCAGPGDSWSAADGDEALSECMHTYRHASVLDPRGVFTATIGIEWEISWRSNVASGGALPAHTTHRTYDVEVRDVQAIVVDS